MTGLYFNSNNSEGPAPTAKHPFAKEKSRQDPKTSGRSSFLREWRLYKGMTGTEVGKRVDMCRSAVSRLENSNRRMTIDHMRCFGKALGIRPEDLLRLPPGTAEVRSPFARADNTHLNEVELNREDPELGMQLSSSYSMIRVQSDEMFPTVARNEHVIVDSELCHYVGSGIYLIRLHGIECLRRLQQVGTLIRVTCDNSAYTAEEIQEHSIVVLGRIVRAIKNV